MPTPDDVYSGINQRMQDAMRKLREGGSAASSDAQRRLGGSFEPLQRGLAGMNPVTSIMSVGQQAAPHIRNVADKVGGTINKPGVREWTNDPIVNAVAGSNPVTSAAMTAIQGSRLINAQGKKSNSDITKAEPTQNPERPTTPGVSGAEVPALGGKTYSVMGVKYDSATGQAINPGTGKTSSGGYSIDPQSGSRTDYSRGQTRIDAKGNIQTGTNTSPPPMTMDDANKLLTGGYKMNQNYASNQLPYTQSSPYAGKGNAEIYNQETLHQHDSDVDYVSLSKDIYKDQSGVESYTRSGEMNKDYKQMDVNPGESVPEEKINWANRTMADNSDEKLARRRAFLDAKGTMQGLRRSEAVQNISYAGGQHYIGDGKGGKNLIAVTEREDVYKYKSGQEGAREIRDKYVNALTSKENAEPALPDSEQAAGNVETSPNQKPLTVAPSDIPSDLSGAAGEEYLRKLDAGQFTRNR